jgi:hypothetical protein
MKKFLAIAVIAATLTSCGGGKTEEVAPVDTTTVAAPVDTIVAAPVDTTLAPAADSAK